MDERDLKRLGKGELIDLLTERAKEIEGLKADLSSANQKLSSNRIELEEAGSIAEASLAVTHIFEEADKAAKIYLENIRRKYE